MQWDEFHKAVSAEFSSFPVPQKFRRVAAAEENKIGSVIGVLDNEHRFAVDDIVSKFAETRQWKIESEVHRVLIWLRLSFGRDFFGFLTLGMEKFDPEWKPFSIVARVHDACDDAHLSRWLLIDAWHRCGVPQIQRVLYCVSHFRGTSKRQQ